MTTSIFKDEGLIGLDGHIKIWDPISGDIFVNQFTGSLKQTKLNIQPFYIIKRIDYFHY